MMLHRQHNKRTQKISVVSLSSLLQFQIIKEPCSEEHLVNARCKVSADNLHMTFPEITIVFKPVGGATRDRTADLLRARQALSQLSYNPLDW